MVGFLRSYALVFVVSFSVLWSTAAMGQGSVQLDAAEPAEDLGALEREVNRLKAELKIAERKLKEARGNAGDQNASGISRGALVVVSGDSGSGSGFMAEIKGRVFFVTNIHVLGAARDSTFTTIDGNRVVLGEVAYLSQNRDVAIVPVEWDGPVLRLSTSLSLDDVGIGQRVTVMGNSSGANVTTRITGVIRGIGPEEVEVSAKFVPGNSGSPIVHDSLGTVIAIASYLRDYSDDSKWTEGSDFNKIRRFGYRLDGDISWAQVRLSDLYLQGEAYNRFEERTTAMWNISYMLTYESQLLTSYRDHASLGHLYDDISSDFNWGRGTASAHNVQMLRRFLNSMTSEVHNDISDTSQSLNIGYYRQRFDDIKNYRNLIGKNLIRFSESRL